MTKPKTKNLTISIPVIAILIIIITVMGWIIFYRIDNPQVEVRYVDRTIKEKETITIKEYIGKDIEWHDDFIITGYTQYDEGCTNTTSIGVNLDKSWTRYFNFVAVDPDIIPYGKTVYIKNGNEITEALAADCGGAIVGKHIDFYCEDLEEVYELMKKLDGGQVLVGWVK